MSIFGKGKKDKEVAFGQEVYEKPFGDNSPELTNDPIPPEEVVEALPLTHSALGIYRNDATGTWFVAKFKFNPLTKQVEYVESKEAADGTKGVAMEQFRISASREIFN